MNPAICWERGPSNAAIRGPIISIISRETRSCAPIEASTGNNLTIIYRHTTVYPIRQRRTPYKTSPPSEQARNCLAHNSSIPLHRSASGSSSGRARKTRPRVQINFHWRPLSFVLKYATEQFPILQLRFPKNSRFAKARGSLKTRTRSIGEEERRA